MKILIVLAVTLVSTIACSQNGGKKATSASSIQVGDGCEGCEAIHESPVAFASLKNSVWLPDWSDKGKRLAVKGVVYKADGMPAPDVILYVYHTDQTGIYPMKGDEKGWGKRHGYLRGWMKTNEKGEYEFFTLRPAAYPGRKDPAHIHITIKEPDKNEYWIDDYVFDDDPLLTDSQRKRSQDRGGSGILKITEVDNVLTAERNIYLGKNVPDYPKS